MLHEVRTRVIDSVRGMFAHAETPLLRTGEFEGDPGLCGPGSVSWRVIGDVSVFVGGIRALLIQAAHPEVVAGVEDHSRYRDDPLGRLSRTSFYVTTATYGAMPEVVEAIDKVRAAHGGVSGTSHRGQAYSASAPELAAWVHNTLTDSFLEAYQRFGGRLSVEEADRFVVEQMRVGELLGASPLPATAAGLRAWITGHPALAPSPGMRNAIGFLKRPPIPPAQRVGYLVLMNGAITTIPRRLASVLGVVAVPGARVAAVSLILGLRRVMSNSPAWQAALERCGTPYDPRLFRDQHPGMAQ
ncbi:oxygenase MpaB family protein [Candidatus Poriferisocius sp.]|uniref:oxygenase MpaB family protein n=1 Tax=Candidatus Poriferisocius sp. TaxID=3101276 RepID=UPI003B011E21